MRTSGALTMHLAYVINQYPQASQSFIRREVAALEARGVRVSRFTVRRWPQALVDPADAAERDRTRAVLEGSKLAVLARLGGAAIGELLRSPARFFAALRIALRLGSRANRRLVHLIYLAEACVLRRWIDAAGAGHVHAHFGTNSTAVAMLIRALGGPAYGFTCHGPEEFDAPAALSLGEKIAAASLVVAVSEFGRSQLLRWCRHDQWDKVRVIHCGVDAAFLARADEPAPVPPESRRLVCVGRLEEQKGQLLLIEAAGLLAARGVDFELALVGDGSLRSQIEAKIERLGLKDRVRLLGWMSNERVREQLVQSRAMVLPSFAEGLPVVIMEALALGRPVVTTYVAGIPELVIDGESGHLVPAGSVAALADAMQRALSADAAELTEMGRRGAARVLANHDAAIEAGKLAAAIAATLENTKVREPSPAAPSPSVLAEAR